MIIAKSITHFVKYEQLKLQNHFLEMLTATISHDMRTPLNAILGMSKNLKKYLTEENPKKFHRIIMNSASLMQFLVNDLIDLFRIKNNKFSRTLAKAHLKSHFNDLIEIFTMQA